MKDEEIQVLIDSYRKDLEAYSSAKGIILARMQELESDPQLHENFVSWAGTQVVMNGLILCESKVRGIIEDLQMNKKHDAKVVKLVRS